MHFSDRLVGLDACSPAVAWAKTMPDVRTAYTKCPNGHWLWWLLHKTGSWPDGVEWLCRSRYDEIETEYYRIRRPLEDDRYAKLKPINDEYESAGKKLDHEYVCRTRSICAEYDQLFAELEEKHRIQVANLIRSHVPVEVFLKIFEES